MLAQGKRCPTLAVQPLLDASMPEAAVSTSCSGRSMGRGHGNGDSDFYNDVVREGCYQEIMLGFPQKQTGPWRRQEVVQLPDSCRPVPPRQSARRVAAALGRRQRQLQQGFPALGAPDGHGVHGPLLHVAVLRVEAPRSSVLGKRPRPPLP